MTRDKFTGRIKTPIVCYNYPNDPGPPSTQALPFLQCQDQSYVNQFGIHMRQRPDAVVARDMN